MPAQLAKSDHAQSRTYIITGPTSGFGRATPLEVSKYGTVILVLVYCMDDRPSPATCYGHGSAAAHQQAGRRPRSLPREDHLQVRRPPDRR
jgi:NAD(P)-dependent dehydrogenase (short-subunit alcohol dehydrogenase family)